MHQPSTAQVNTEAMRKGDLQSGLHESLNLDVGLVAGNSSFLLIKATLRLDYLKGTTHTFMVSNLQQGHQGQNHSLFIKKGFVHLRQTRLLHDCFFVEGFVQKEFNYFIRLKDRNLAGGGLRIRWLKAGTDEEETAVIKFYTGLGLMWEQESIEETDNTPTNEDLFKNLFRSTNYLVLRWEPDSRLLFQVTTYFQPDIERLSDFRMLLDGGLTFVLTGKLSAAIKLNVRYDNEPPRNIENYDIELTNGLTYIF
ncbi:MAG: DUF481 domain-containing protein [Calditrichaeota bacterium]|nr:DUF481 domain-containing protein [Calditrichota bacterium]